MKIKYVLSDDLPELSSMIKDCVNLGHWLLFKSFTNDGALDAPKTLYLRTNKQTFKLSAQGEIVEELGSLSLSIDEIIFFSDRAKPKTLSEMVLE